MWGRNPDSLEWVPFSFDSMPTCYSRVAKCTYKSKASEHQTEQTKICVKQICRELAAKHCSQELQLYHRMQKDHKSDVVSNLRELKCQWDASACQLQLLWVTACAQLLLSDWEFRQRIGLTKSSYTIWQSMLSPAVLFLKHLKFLRVLSLLKFQFCLHMTGRRLSAISAGSFIDLCFAYFVSAGVADPPEPINGDRVYCLMHASFLICSGNWVFSAETCAHDEFLRLSQHSWTALGKHCIFSNLETLN